MSRSRESLISSDLRIGAVLGLGEQIGGNEHGIRARIGNHEHFGGAGGHINRGAIRPGERNLALGFGDPGVAGAEQLVAQRGTLAVPNAIAPIACAPPSLNT